MTGVMFLSSVKIYWSFYKVGLSIRSVFQMPYSVSHGRKINHQFGQFLS